MAEKAITSAYDVCDGTKDNVSYGLTRTIYVTSKAVDVLFFLVTGETGNVVIDLPACYEIIDYDLAPYVRRKAREFYATWGKNSDFVVDLGSQMGLGLFFERTVPFVTKPLRKFSNDPGVPHMAIGDFHGKSLDLEGATAHGAEIVEALKNPARKVFDRHSFSPIKLIGLLL